MMELNEVESHVAVRVRDAYKSYSNNVVLRGLNMTVSQGTIYGLLGPSGCGKTTLLRCMVGRCLLDSGCLYVKVKKREKVGYMPQELSLCEEMTVAEVFNYFGRLFGMNWRKIKSRGSELLKFLELPPASRLIGSLSGGQQRRVSFAISLLHNPELLILDEPTVGVDPVLSSSIWESLVKMANLQQKTIIITTHYIEEARQANTIGLMRHGVLLAEAPPLCLMQNQNCSSLEQAFLQLSQRQTLCDSSLIVTNNNPSSITNSEPSNPLEKNGVWRKQRFLAQLVKTFVWNMRNYHMLFFLFVLPVVVAILVNETLGKEDFGSAVGVVSLELKNGFQDCRSTAHYFNCTYSSRPLSCLYIDSLLDRSLIVKEYSNIDDAKYAARKGEVMGVIQFRSNYTDSVFQRIEDGSRTLDGVLNSSIIDVWIDMSNLWMSVTLKRDLIYDMLKLFQELFINCHSSPKLASIPVRFEKPVFGNNQPSFLHFSVPGLMTSFCFYLPVIFTTGSLMAEKSTGQLDRSLVAGLNLLEMVSAHFLTQIIVMSIQTLLMMCIGYVMYYNPLYGSLTLLLILLFLVENLGICYAFFLAIIFDNEKLALFTSTGTIVVLFTICGIVWPIQGMHYILRKVAWAIPLQPAVESYRSIAVQSHFLDHPTVYKGYISTIVWALVLTTTSYFIAQKKKILK
ncbi:ABC transporter G family member 23-like [Lycorma delicatula]|uniref:ABC transporter G family member 23-like n=1 Tax=Lycorma delicatula TaxID=130591 RepID=UPI003F50FBDA